jgi:acetoacetyl-CoA synthetase
MDSLIVDTGRLGQEGQLILFIVLTEQSKLDEPLVDKIRKGLRKELSPRHVPDQIYAIPQIPKTLNGKKLEVPIKKILSGVPIDQAINKDAMENPFALEYIQQLFKE